MKFAIRPIGAAAAPPDAVEVQVGVETEVYISHRLAGEYLKLMSLRNLPPEPEAEAAPEPSKQYDRG